MMLTQDQLEALCAIALEAGREIMDVYGGPVTVWEKDDASPLTAADLRADSAIRHGLAAAFPGMFILSEESTTGSLAAGAAYFLVDPLDGTKEFLKRNGEFTVNIALIDEGEPVAGVVLAPALEEMFYAARGQGAWKRRQGDAPVALDLSHYARPQTLRVMGSRSHGADRVQQWLAAWGETYEFMPGGSSLKFCRIAEGRADVYPRLGPTSQWDTAAAQAVLEEAGGAVLDPSGKPLRYGVERPSLNPFFVALADPRQATPALD